MAELKIEPSLWNGLKAAAARQGKQPEALARRALREFLERLADEELIKESRKAAAVAPFKIKDTEAVIRQFRRQKSR